MRKSDQNYELWKSVLWSSISHTHFHSRHISCDNPVKSLPGSLLIYCNQEYKDEINFQSKDIYSLLIRKISLDKLNSW